MKDLIGQIGPLRSLRNRRDLALYAKALHRTWGDDPDHGPFYDKCHCGRWDCKAWKAYWRYEALTRGVV